MADLSNHDQPLVSVMMPVYNGEKTIELAISSLLYQTYSNWLCIIVNDCSTDGTAQILQRYENNNRFKIIHLPKNVGRGAARQIALENSEGDYLAYLDADDFYHADKLLRQVGLLNKNKNLSLVGGRTVVFNSDYEAYSLRGVFPTHTILYELGDSMKISMSTAMIRLPEAKSIKYNSKLNASEDRDFFSRYLNGKQYQNIPEVMLYYLVSESASSYSKILQYTGYEIRRGIFLFAENKRASMRIIFKSGIKWIAYAISIPLLGTKFFLNRRGNPLPEEDKNIFIQQKNKLDKLMSL